MRIRLLAAFLCIAQMLSAQSNDPYKFLARYDPPKSPNASNFERYTTIPGNYETGQIDYGIPLMQFTVDGLTVPLALRYSNTGLKTSDVASWVGLGWNLNVGGTITRTVKGLPDDGSFGLMDTVAANKLDKLARGQMYGLEKYDFFRSVAQQLADTEHDFFYYDLLGVKGSFYIGRSGKCIQMPRSNKVIQFTKDVNGRLDKFTVTDEKGQTFYFNQKEESTVNSITNSVNGNDPSYYVKLRGTTWYLTQVVTQNGEIINFYYNHYQYNRKEKTESIALASITGAGLQCPGAAGYRMTYINSTVDVYQLSSIYWKNGFIKFTPGSNRTDLTNIDAAAAVPCLASVSLYRSTIPFAQDLGTVVQTVTFDYTQGARLFLKKVSFKDRNTGNTDNSYRFNYINDNSVSPWPSYNVSDNTYNAQDYWGYFNGIMNNPQLIPYAAVGLYPYIDGSTYNATYSIANYLTMTNRVPNPAYACYGMLKEIYYPTGGKTKFTYEGNIVLKSNISYGVGGTTVLANTLIQGTDAQNNPLVTLGGMRVKKIEFYADPNAANPSLQTNIVYDQANISTKFLPNFVTTLERQYVISVESPIDGCNTCVNKYVFNLYSNSVVANPAPIVEYHRVTEYKGASNAAGQVVHDYRFSTIGPGQYWGCPNTQPFYFSWYAGEAATSNQLPNGTIVNEKYTGYGTNDSLMSPVDLINRFDADVKLAVYRNDECTNAPYSNTTAPADDNAAETYLGGTYRWETVILPTENYVSTLTRETVMDNAGRSYQRLTNYNYSPGQANKLVPASSVTTNSMGDSVRSQFSYPRDYFPGMVAGTSDPVVNGLVNLLNKNLTDMPVEEIRTIKQNGTEYVTGGQLFLYFPDRLSVSKVLDFSANAPIPLATFTKSYINAGGTFVYDSRYKLAKQYYTFNASNLPIEYSEGQSGFRHSLLWDYNASYQVADVAGATQDQIAYTSFDGDGTGNWTVGSTARDVLGGVTGSSCYSLNSDIYKSGIDPLTTYVVSYWTLNSTPYTIAGTLAGYPVKGKTVTINNRIWTYYEHRIKGQSAAVLSGTGGIDELRLYPLGAQMTTYTYFPLIGMTSQCDIGNKISYFVYDGVNRLQQVKDQDGNILKTIEYHYTGQ